MQWSVEVRALVDAPSTYRDLALRRMEHRWAGRRPALLLFSLGALVSVLVSGRFSVRVIVDGALSFAFVPATEIAAFAVVFGLITRRARLDTNLAAAPPGGITFGRALDLFFVGNAPWLLWFVIVAAAGSVVPPREIGPWIIPALYGSIATAVWAAYLDFHFFRQVMRRTAADALRDVALHHAFGWTAALAYFFGIAIWSETLPEIIRWIRK
jgi:hypothetical protein